MKKFSILFFMLGNICLFSQFTISTEYTDLYMWDDNNNEWGDVVTEYENYTFLEFNEEFTFMTLTTFGDKTSYFLSNPEYDEELDHHTYDATSDSGYETTLIVDIKAEKPNIRFIIDIEESTILVRHKVKTWFSDEE